MVENQFDYLVKVILDREVATGRQVKLVSVTSKYLEILMDDALTAESKNVYIHYDINDEQEEDFVLIQ